MEKYDHKKIEKKWQEKWEKDGLYNAKEEKGKKKFYALIEFPYPSGVGLHVGHVRSNTAMDIIARKRRSEGYNVLYPIGWDAFGLPTENYAIKTGIHPSVVTKENTDMFREQLKRIGFSFDWSREINTTDPTYYKWTQWIFLQMFKKDLAYKAKIPINWCLSCKIGLANEEVVDGVCERCDGPVEKREKEQWMLAITKYADRLHNDLDDVDFDERIKIQQRNWIGRSNGANIDFKIVGNDQKIKVFTTRPDTLYGATYMVLAPEHSIVQELQPNISNWDEVGAYITKTSQQTDIDRMAEGKEKTGVELDGVKAINPANGKEIPVFIADYVLGHYGTGAIMAVPAHDERDFEFAKKFDLPIVPVVLFGGNVQLGWTVEKYSDEWHDHYIKEGKLINSDEFDGVESKEAKQKITEKVGGEMTVTYKLNDWVFSRQRYWGEPIPIIHCEKCGAVPVPEDQLPVELPDVEKYEPTDTGESPLANITDWVNVKCPECEGDAKRETDTMPNWAGSSWYFLRYTDPKNNEALASEEALKYWTPVDWYNGGMEHTTLHLLYSRFWHKFLFDIGVAPTSEPYAKRTSHGLILAEDGSKMSKSKGSVVNPDDIISLYGADTLRMYEMFMGPFEQAIAWETQNIIGPRRFLEKVWEYTNTYKESSDSSEKAGRLINQTIKKVSEDIENMRFNTAISQLMIFMNDVKGEEVSVSDIKSFVKILSPFAPHIAEEVWEKLGESGSIHTENWPEYDESKLTSDTMTIVVQVNGKVRGTFEVEATADQAKIEEMSQQVEGVKKHIDGQEPRKIIYIPGKLINIVI